VENNNKNINQPKMKSILFAGCALFALVSGSKMEQV